MEKEMVAPEGIIDNIPTQPGVYLMKDNYNKVIYVGKAKNLKNRVSSYFTKKTFVRKKVQKMVRKIKKIDYIICGTELDALLVENNLIKKYKPKYNIVLKDEKTYPYIKITNEKYPKLEIIRNRNKLKSKSGDYFGPYTSGVYKIIKILQKTFPIRDCKKDMSKKYKRPCLKYHMKRCIAPCVKKNIKKEYDIHVERLKRSLKGENQEIISELKDKMMNFSEKKDYEKAIVYREKINEIKKLNKTQISEYGKKIDEDVFVYKREGNYMFIYVLNIRDGKIIGDNDLRFRSEFDLDGSDFEKIFVQYYDNYPLPRNIILHKKDEIKQELILKWIEKMEENKTNKKRGSVHLMFPKIKSRHMRLLNMANINLEEKISKYFLKRKVIKAGLNQLKTKLKLKRIPIKIECFDISNIQGKDAVGAMSVFVKGRKSKKDYRKFKIRGEQSPDDFRMMREVLTRRYSKLDISDLPDLILIDGGKGQLGIAKEVLEKEDKLKYLDIISIAKKEELVFKAGDKRPYRLDINTEGIKILQRLRDEAHRFGITYHRKLRKKRIMNGQLDNIKGIGPKRKRELLNKFKSYKRIKNTSIEKLMEVVPEKVARRIKERGKK
ncbi:MAG: excinuclease ABC subunit UvrC [Fusobacteriota bacterium]